MERGWIIHHFPAVFPILLLKLKLPYVHHVFHLQPCLLILIHLNDYILSLVCVSLVLLPLSSPVPKFSSRCPPLTVTSTFSSVTVPLSTSMLTSKIFPKSRAKYPPTFYGDIIGRMLSSIFFLASRCLGGQHHALRKICRVVSFAKPRCKLLWPLWQESIFLLALLLAPSVYREQIC